MTSRGVSHAEDAPRAFWQVDVELIGLHFRTDDILRTEVVLGRQVCLWRLGGDAPNVTGFALPVVDERPTIEAHALQSQHGLPLGGIEVFGPRFGALWRPFKTEVFGCSRGD